MKARQRLGLPNLLCQMQGTVAEPCLHMQHTWNEDFQGPAMAASAWSLCHSRTTFSQGL